MESWWHLGAIGCGGGGAPNTTSDYALSDHAPWATAEIKEKKQRNPTNKHWLTLVKCPVVMRKSNKHTSSVPGNIYWKNVGESELKIYICESARRWNQSHTCKRASRLLHVSKHTHIWRKKNVCTHGISHVYVDAMGEPAALSMGVPDAWCMGEPGTVYTDWSHAPMFTPERGTVSVYEVRKSVGERTDKSVYELRKSWYVPGIIGESELRIAVSTTFEWSECRKHTYTQKDSNLTYTLNSLTLTSNLSFFALFG